MSNGKGKENAPGQLKKRSNSSPIAQFRSYQRPDGAWLLTDETIDPDGEIIARQWTTDEGGKGTGRTFVLTPICGQPRDVRVVLVVHDNRQAFSQTDGVFHVAFTDACLPDPPEGEPSEPPLEEEPVDPTEPEEPTEPEPEPEEPPPDAEPEETGEEPHPEPEEPPTEPEPEEPGEEPEEPEEPETPEEPEEPDPGEEPHEPEPEPENEAPDTPSVETSDIGPTFAWFTGSPFNDPA